MTWTNMMCIPKGARQPKLAWEFMTCYCGMENARWKLKSINRNAPLAAFYGTPEWRQAVEKHPYLVNIPQITEVGGPYPVVRFTEIDSIFRPLCEGLMLNNLTPEQVLDRAGPKIDAILREYYIQLEEAYR
jgi:ABC-type glycerol-3-phosphate transport system substrate-binding protein